MSLEKLIDIELLGTFKQEQDEYNANTYAKIGESGSTSITVDDVMSDTSTNPVQNKVIKEYVDSKEISVSEKENNAIVKETDGLYVEISSGKDGKSTYEIACDSGFEGSEEEWLESLKGEDGRSITSITTDENNNVIATFSDGLTQNIGKLNVDVSSNFLTEEGFGSLRYYNSRFQYYDTTTSSWIDTSVTSDNIYIINMIPQPMVSFYGRYRVSSGHFQLKFKEPSDTIIDGQVTCLVEKVIVRRKLDSTPTNENDGELVIEVKRNNFGSYDNVWFTDESFTPNDGETWYYKAFPINTLGYANNSSLNEVSINAKSGIVYGFRIDQNESDPGSMITYLPDCDNANYQSAYMDFETGTFNYGDWTSAWFIEELKPCMLNYDGTVAYELDPNDYSLKKDGTPSDITDSMFEGNAMIGIPKVYWKIIDNGDETADIYISNKQMDSDYHCWSHIDSKGNEIDYCYMGIYTTIFIDSVGRSLSTGTICSQNISSVDKLNYVFANNTTDDVIWYGETYADYTLLQLLTMLIGKSTQSQKTFGYGLITGSSAFKSIGALNTNGLFWGVNSYNTYGVKVFGMEHLWGGENHLLSGIVMLENGGALKIKMTYDKSDGSLVNGYNTTGDGYITIVDNMSGVITESGYIKQMTFSEYGLIPKAIGGSSSTYYCDYMNSVSNNTAPRPALFGQYYVTSGTTYNMYAGIFRMNFADTALYPRESNVRLSCKPLALTL